MGRNSGGVKASGTKSGGISRGATEQGYSAKMAKNILGMEGKIRGNKDESLHVFSQSGNLLKSVGGKGAQVAYDPKDIPANSILTHNHPRSLGATGIRRIGNSFSVQDIVSAVNVNAREIRAVTPTYTFSVKRPKGGWGGSAKQVGDAFMKANKEVQSEMHAYLNKTGWSDDSIARAETTHYHRVMQKMAKKYGWSYSKKRG